MIFGGELRLQLLETGLEQIHARQNVDEENAVQVCLTLQRFEPTNNLLVKLPEHLAVLVVLQSFGHCFVLHEFLSPR